MASRVLALGLLTLLLAGPGVAEAQVVRVGGAVPIAAMFSPIQDDENADDGAADEAVDAEDEEGIDDKIDAAFMPFADKWEGLVLTSIPGIGAPFVLVLLVGGAAFFTLYFAFINIRRFPLAINVVRGKYDEIEGGNQPITTDTVNVVDGDVVDTIRDEGEGEVNHFQALATAVSGTVGLGNIGSVAVAIAAGGPGATFWMIVCGLLGMCTKFVECTLGVKYRDVDASGTVYGGPMYYLSKGLAERGLGGAGKVLGVLFAVLCVGASFGGGNAFQSNQATQQLINEYGLSEKLESAVPALAGSEGFLLGCILAVLVGIVIIGGIKRIASITEKIVPFMAILYIVACLTVIAMSFDRLGTAISQILSQAFTPGAGLGGALGVLMVGFQRAAFSNEAGCGSAAIAHSAVKTKYPASEGIVALLEPFIDTVMICTMTALVIVLFNIDDEAGEIDTKSVTMSATELTFVPGTVGDEKKQIERVAPKLTRASGSWADDGFAKDFAIQIAGAGEDKNNGTFYVEEVAGADLLLYAAKDMAAESVAEATVEGAATNPTGVFVYGNKNADGNLIRRDGGEPLGGVTLTSAAFASKISWFPNVLTIAIVLFAFSTLISWSYYGLQSWKYLFGKSAGADLAYKLVFLGFIVIGASVKMNAVIKFSDAMILALVFPNMVGLFLLAPRVKEELGKYLSAIKVK